MVEGDIVHPRFKIQLNKTAIPGEVRDGCNSDLFLRLLDGGSIPPCSTKGIDMSRTRFLCTDCGIDTGKAGEYFMLRDEVWFSVFPSKFGMLCVGCVESRLGRELNPQDFNDSYLNTSRKFARSIRLSSRMA